MTDGKNEMNLNESTTPSIGVYGFKEVDQTIGPYRILALLGQGGQGAVYKATDRRIGRTVALKVLHGVSGSATDLLLRFRREAEITAKLEHPSICPVYEVGLDAAPFIAMRLVEGKTLAQHLATARSKATEAAAKLSFVELAADLDGTQVVSASEREGALSGSLDPHRPTPITTSGTPRGRGDIFDVLLVIERTARALHTAHEAGVIHRDIKPGNIMVQKDGTPVILDFGLAYQEEHEGPSLSVTGQLMGTPAYMAPEQIAAKRLRVDRRADVYSLGVTLYECLTLMRPFDAPTREGLYQAIAFKDPLSPRSLNPAISSDVQVVLLKALEKDPDVRFQTAENFAEELRRIRSFEPITTRPVGPLRRHMRWIQRNPGWAVAVYGIFVALALAAGVFSFKNAQLDRTNKALEKKTAEADANATRAQKESAARGLALADYDRLADSTLFAQAKAEADALLPVSPEMVARIESWQRTYAPLFDRLTSHEETLAKLRENAPPYTDQLRAKDYGEDSAKGIVLEAALKEAREKARDSPKDERLVEAAEDAEDAAKKARRIFLSRPRRSADFGADTTTQFKHDVLARLVEDMRVFSDPKTGELADVQARLVRSREIKKKTIDDHATAWSEAISRIAANPKYGGLQLNEQVGLIPLGPDKVSTLEEFYDTETGEAPVRDATGKIVVTEKSALVFVLIPGGTFLMGAQKEDKAKPNYDPWSFDNEGPVHELTLSAYFLSKYEMTQGQWVRTAKGVRLNPSHYVNANYEEYDFAATFDLRNPVEQVSWEDGRDRLQRLGYRLPTEAQWEYACRAGTRTPWSAGEEVKSLERYANLADRSKGRWFAGQIEQAIDDKYPAVSPVGAFVANGFGLHDMHGNVHEWCEDAYGPYGGASHRIGDGLLEILGAPNRASRGGSFGVPPLFARSAFRSRDDPSNRNLILGLRPARRITAP